MTRRPRLANVEFLIDLAADDETQAWYMIAVHPDGSQVGFGDSTGTDEAMVNLVAATMYGWSRDSDLSAPEFVEAVVERYNEIDDYSRSHTDE